MSASAWAEPPAVGYQAHRNALLPVSTQLHAAAPGAVAVAAEGMNHPSMAALRTTDEARPWELTGLPNRYTTGELMFISSSWRLLQSAVDEEDAS